MGQNLSHLVHMPNLGICFLAHNSAIFCLIRITIHIQVPETTNINYYNIRHVARIFERGGLLASEASKLRQGSGGAAPSGVKGRRPLRGVRGAELPGNMASYTTFGNKDRVLNLLLT